MYQPNLLGQISQLSLTLYDSFREGEKGVEETLTCLDH